MVRISKIARQDLNAAWDLLPAKPFVWGVFFAEFTYLVCMYDCGEGVNPERGETMRTAKIFTSSVPVPKQGVISPMAKGEPFTAELHRVLSSNLISCF